MEFFTPKICSVCLKTGIFRVSSFSQNSPVKRREFLGFCVNLAKIKMLPFQKFKFFFSAIICLILVENYCPVFGHKLDLSDDVSVTWNSTDPVWLTMEMTVVGGGYVAVGFSPQGAMTGADMVLGWVDKDGVPHLMVIFRILHFYRNNLCINLYTQIICRDFYFF